MKAVPVQRDSMGWWEHPDLERHLIDTREMPHQSNNSKTLKSHGIEIMHMPLIDGEQSDAHSDIDISHAQLPDAPGPEWFCVLIWYPTGIEPSAWFARHFAPQQNLFAEVSA